MFCIGFSVSYQQIHKLVSSKYPKREDLQSVLLTVRGSTGVKLLRYKSEGRWFDSRWCYWNFSLT